MKQKTLKIAMGVQEESKVETIYELPLPKEEILAIIQNAVSQSDTYMSEKKSQIKDNYSFYSAFANVDKKRNMQGITTFVTIQLYNALENKDKLSVEFKPGNENPNTIEKSKFLTNNAENDYKVGRYEKEWKKAIFERFFTGIGVIHLNGWDSIRQLPIVTFVPTLNVLFDPEGGHEVNNHRWIGFTMEYKVSSLYEADKVFDRGQLEDLLKRINTLDEKDGSSNSRDDEIRVFLQNINGLNVTSTTESAGKIVNHEAIRNVGSLRCYDIYLSLLDKESKKTYKYQITVNRGLTHILRCKRLNPLTKAEKANPDLVPFPVVLNQFIRVSDEEPIGLSVFDLVRNMQTMISTILNAGKDLVVKNLQGTLALKKGSINPNSINYASDEVVELEIAEHESIRDVISPMPVQNLNHSEIISLVDKIESNAEKVTGVSDAQLGIGDKSFETLGEAETAQNNSNIRHRDRIEQTLKAKVEFWEKWYRSYRANYKGKNSNLKEVNIQDGSVGITYKLKSNDFSSDHPIIVIKSKEFEKDQKRTQYLTLKEMIPYLSTTGGKTEIKEATLMMLKASDSFSQEEIERLVPKNYIEIIIESETNLLSQNIDVPLPRDLTPEGVMARIKMQSQIPTEAGLQRRIQLFQIATSMGLDSEVSNMTQQQEEQPVHMGGNSNALEATRDKAVEKGRSNVTA